MMSATQNKACPATFFYSHQSHQTSFWTSVYLITGTACVQMKQKRKRKTTSLIYRCR